MAHRHGSHLTPNESVLRFCKKLFLNFMGSKLHCEKYYGVKIDGVKFHGVKIHATKNSHNQEFMGSKIHGVKTHGIKIHGVINSRGQNSRCHNSWVNFFRVKIPGGQRWTPIFSQLYYNIKCQKKSWENMGVQIWPNEFWPQMLST